MTTTSSGFTYKLIEFKKILHGALLFLTFPHSNKAGSTQCLIKKRTKQEQTAAAIQATNQHNGIK